MARTTRYKAGHFAALKIRRQEEERVRRLERAEREEAVRTGMKEWTEQVVGALGLCPFAPRHEVRVVVSHLGRSDATDTTADADADSVIAQMQQAVQVEAETLGNKSPHDPFCSVLIVFPNYANQLEPLYSHVLDSSSCKGLIGGVSDLVPTSKYQKIQAFPFEGQAVNQSKLEQGFDVTPLPGMAPWTTIQLIRYSDLAKIPLAVRTRIMQQNDQRTNHDDALFSSSPADRLRMLKACGRSSGTNGKLKPTANKVPRTTRRSARRMASHQP